MKKITNYILLTTCVFFLSFTALPITAPYTNIIPTKVAAAEITPRADQIVWKYRILSDGTVQKRRWNATKAYWVDPHWITVK